MRRMASAGAWHSPRPGRHRSDRSLHSETAGRCRTPGHRALPSAPASTLPGRMARRDLPRPLDLGACRPVAAIHATGAWLLPPHLAALRAAGVRRLVCFSSTSMLAKADSPRPLSARSPASPRPKRRWPQAASPGLLLRPTLIYGLGLDRNVTAAARFIRRWHFFPLGGPGPGLRQPVHADDLAAAARGARRPAAAGHSISAAARR